MSEQYFTPVDKLPRRCHLHNICQSILEDFLRSDKRLVKVNLEVFNNRKPECIQASLMRYCKKFNYSVIPHCIKNEIYLERL
jgi:hypothetical protein